MWVTLALTGKPGGAGDFFFVFERDVMITRVEVVGVGEVLGKRARTKEENTYRNVDIEFKGETMSFGCEEGLFGMLPAEGTMVKCRARIRSTRGGTFFDLLECEPVGSDGKSRASR